jgi:murein DD-endopeptidase MepM/ murein hydrolase activator NlpD
MHTGVDIGAAYGSNVLASNGGKVILSQYWSGYGNAVIIDHGSGITTLYGHNSKLLVSEGQIVKKGDKIAISGSTGISTGPHVHFEVRRNGAPVDPIGYVK